ncbi:hypothetical protein F5Y07DRAFT_363991 [Xylaria sp. FL0933]|nr:hypothetical protein F5Y07DRAFT_363991 [Xylaria sp. FL0933]
MSSSISRLPDSATRFISSHAVIVSPDLLVKELLDNAIDAKATSVEILISPDTISKVEVRDNGVGIHPDDFDALGRHGHTSKLRNIGELGSRVGESLGFRGEALASVNSVADVTITTKTSVEPVATIFQLKPNEGGVLTHKSASAPVGTTVNVTSLFGRQPVRRQVFAREAKKTLDKIQELLRAYIMARPQIKIMYKVLNIPTKAWSYSPKPNATVIEGALQLFGTEVTSNCHLKTSQGGYTSANGDSSARLTTSNFSIEAFLANPEANLRSLPKLHYFSVDCRPLNASRGAAKRLLKIYLEYLRRSAIVKDISECFIRLNISCPPNSYDANVEPSKDDVLFSNQGVIEDAFRYMCNEVYRPAAESNRNSLGTADSQANSPSTTHNLGHNQIHQTPSSQIQSILPDRTPQIAQSSSQIPVDVPAEVSHYNTETHVRQASFAGNSTGERLGKPQTSTLASFKPINTRGIPSYLNPRNSGNEPANPTSASNLWKIDRSVDLDDHQEQSQQRKTREQPIGSYVTEIDGERNIGDRLNPWATAKKYGPTEATPDAKSNGASERSLTPEPPILRHIMAPPGDLDVPGTHRDMERTKLPCLQRPHVPGGPYRSPMASPSNSKTQTTSVVPTNHSHTTRRRREHIPWTPPSSVEKQRFVDMPHIDSTRPPRADGLKQTQISFGGAPSGRRRGETQSGGSQPALPSGELYSELESNKDIPRQNMFSTAKRNLHYQLSQMGEVEAPENSHSGESHLHHQRPSRRRQPFSVLHTNTFGCGDVPQEARQPIPTTLPIGDPRAYLLRRQKSMASAGNDAKATKLSRVKSSLMPFENSPPEYQTRVLSWTVGVDGSALEASVRKARKYDKYVVYGALVDGLDMSLSDGRAVESQLQKLLADQKENFGDGNTIVDINLQSTLKGKSVLDT